ncbi:MAG: hypothetical protein KC503_18820 [Myxococcales bacterium]|nr:hypothetical protein [Myxococcales bacterium]
MSDWILDDLFDSSDVNEEAEARRENEAAKVAADLAQSRAAHQERKLKARVERLELMTEALIRALRAKDVIDIEGLRAIVRGLDLTSGSLDGRMDPTVREDV